MAVDRCVSCERGVMSSGATFRDCFAVSQLDYVMWVKVCPLYWSRSVHCTRQCMSSVLDKVSTVLVKKCPL